MHPHGKYPSIMAELFGNMPLDSPYFVIRPLDMRNMKMEMPPRMVKSNVHCFLYITGGEVLADIADRPIYFRANECIAIPAGRPFSVRYFDNCTGYMGAFNNEYMDCNSDGRNIMQAFSILRRWNTPKVMFGENEARGIVGILERILKESRTHPNPKIVRAYLAAFLTEIEEASRLGDVNDELRAENELCNKYIEMVFERPDHSIPLSDYAERLHVSKGYLHKIIREQTGKTPLDWIVEAVLLEAKTLLGHTTNPVSEIAFAVGIADPSYFSRLFKKHTGTTPIEYRKSRKC